MEISVPYLAGFIDGEGCMMVARLKYATECKRGIRYAPVMNIANTHLPILQLIQLKFGGKIREMGLKENPGNYLLHFSVKEMKNIIPQILPYLIVKRDQAELFLEFLKSRESYGARALSDEQFRYTEDCYSKIKNMKKVRFELSAGA